MSGPWRELADLVLPVDCAGCGRTQDGALCGACRTRWCGEDTVRRAWPDPVPPGLPAVYAAGAYEDELRAVLLAHKERGVLRLAQPLGDALACAVRTALAIRGREGRGEGPHPDALFRPDHPTDPLTGHPADPLTDHPTGPRTPHPGAPVLLVPVPSARVATAARGHDPVRRMALRAARQLRRAGVAARVVPVLRQRRAVADQAALSAAGRLANLAGALGVVSGGGRLLTAGPVIVVDDLMTTGASLAEAARVVRAAGGRVEAAGVVAASPRSYGLPGAVTGPSGRRTGTADRRTGRGEGVTERVAGPRRRR